VLAPTLKPLSPHLSHEISLFCLASLVAACAGASEHGARADAGRGIGPGAGPCVACVDDGGGASARETEGGAPDGGRVGVTGGRVSVLSFVVVGDTRPPTVDDTSAYPTAIITQIFRDVESLEPMPLFGLSTGDYMFASTGGGQAARQLNLYLHARAGYSGLMFPALGNHECTGATASNCGSGNADGITDNYTQFVTKMLQPLGLASPYYSIRIDSSSGAWTAKFVFVAANAWDAAQASWLETTLAQATTYTFIVRHEPSSAITAPGVIPADEIILKHPYTLLIAGHSHTYARSGAKEVIIGNGGAPLTSSGVNYGFGLFQQRADRAIQVDVVDYATMLRDTSFTFAVEANGAPAP
jgi:hypothetical protein